MTGPVARWLSGNRLHLQHGPIDLIVRAEGPARDAAYRAAVERFGTVLTDLVAELPVLRTDAAERAPTGVIALSMHRAAIAHRPRAFVTPMAAVAGAVADTILGVMLAAGSLDRAFVNNGGDIALHLGQGRTFRVAMLDLDRADGGRITIRPADGIGGIATSGRGGRSLSRGIADRVTVLARTAAEADVAATLIANAVDLPGHPAVTRRPACALDPDSDLGNRLVVTDLGPLSADEACAALDRGLATAEDMRARGLIVGTALALRGQTRVTGVPVRTLVPA